MSDLHNWISRHVDDVLLASILFALLIALFGCAPMETYTFDFCKAGMGGEYRVLVPPDPEDLPVLAVFPKGGPYDSDHVRCVVSGDHSILDMGKDNKDL